MPRAAAPALVLALVSLLLAGLFPGPARGAEETAAAVDDPLALQARAEKKALIADFGLGTCLTCRQQKLVLENIGKDYGGKVEVRFLNPYKEKELADLHRVVTVPTLLFYDPAGTLVLRQEGGMNYLQIADQLGKMGVKP